MTSYSPSSGSVDLGPALSNLATLQPRLGRILVERGSVTAEELQLALREQRISGRRIGEILLSMHAVSSRELSMALAEQLRVPFVDLRATAPDPRLAHLVPHDVAQRLEVLAVARWADQIVVAMPNPNDEEALDLLEATIRKRIVAAVADPVELRRTIDATYAPPTEVEPPRTITCPGCGATVPVGADVWVMQEVSRLPSQTYVWDTDPAAAPPIHICSGEAVR